MKIFAKFVGLLFVLLGIGVAVFTVQLSMDNLTGIPVLLKPVEEAQEKAAALMDAVCDGDYATAGTLIYGKPDLGAAREASDEAGRMIWDALVESYDYRLLGDCYATDSGVAQNVSVTYLEISSVTQDLRRRTQDWLQAMRDSAEDVSDIYDENNDFKEEVVMEALKMAVSDALREDAKLTTVEFTINLAYRDGTWVVVSDPALMAAISGNIIK